MLIRSWNLFHGRTVRTGSGVHLREMVELASADAPDVLCLQELPLWALSRLEGWSGMTAFPAVAKRTPVPQPLEHRTVRISDRGRERRVCHAVRLADIVIGNVHASNEFSHPEVPRAELKRAHELVESMAARGEARVLAGDFNLRDPDLPGPNIDHIVVAGIEHGALEVWRADRRLHNGAVLSDHAPVEMRIG